MVNGAKFLVHWRYLVFLPTDRCAHARAQRAASAGGSAHSLCCPGAGSSVVLKRPENLRHSEYWLSVWAQVFVVCLEKKVHKPLATPQNCTLTVTASLPDPVPLALCLKMLALVLPHTGPK